MKTRYDFVSNSSSCSFVIAIFGEDKYKFKDFVKDIANDCISSKDADDRLLAKKLKEFNTRVLDYHLNFSELLFLGTLKLEDKLHTLCRPDPKDYSTDTDSNYEYDLEAFNNIKKSLSKKDFGKHTGEKLIEMSDDKLTWTYPVYANGIAFPSTHIESLTGHYSFCDPAKETAEDRKKAYECIMDLMKRVKGDDNWNLSYFINRSTYFISKQTIWNTLAMLENGAELSFESWEDLDVLEKRLDAGERLYVIKQNQGGDGMDNDAIYALGGWDCKFGKNANIEVIYSECM